MRNFPLLFLVLAIPVVLSTGCEFRYEQRPDGKPIIEAEWSVVEFRGHTYVQWDGSYAGGIVHDPDCACKGTIVKK